MQVLEAESGRGSEAQGRMSRWLDRLYALRDRIIGDARFQRFAADFPLTRPIARRQASALFDICAGFVYSQVLAACVDLGLFDMLRGDAQTPEQLASRCAVPLDAMQRLLAAAASLGLLEARSGGRYGLGMKGAALSGNPGIAAMVAHHAMLYEDLRDPVGLLRKGRSGTQLSRYWPYASGAAAEIDPSGVRGYTALMSSSQGLIAEDILAAHDFTRHRHLLDIGGGDGAFLIAAAARAPSLRMTLFDLPPVAAIAESRFAEHGITARAEAISGNFLTEPLPRGADLVTLIRIILDHDDAAALKIFRAARAAIAPGGALLVAEPISGLTGSRPVSDAYFGLYLFAMGRGRARTFQELKTLLNRAGFSHVKAKATRRPLLTNLLIARPELRTTCDNLY